jgi:uncharacterized protein (TIGR03581 family)
MIKFYKDRLCLNCLASDIDNAKEILKAMDNYALVGLLSANYENISSAVEDMKMYQIECENHISVGLGGGNPNQWRMVADISQQIKPDHVNQIFSAVGYTRAKIDGDKVFINSLISPCGKVGYVKVSTGPLSSKEEDAIIPIDTAIAMIKEMGGNSVKFFPMKGLQYKDEYVAVAQACARNDFYLEPTGGIDLDNLEEIIQIALDAKVKKIIPHVYTSIIDSVTGKTKPEDVKSIFNIFKKCIG